MTDPADLKALLRAFDEAIPHATDLTQEIQAQNRAHLRRWEALAASQAETVFRAQLEALKAARSAGAVSAGLAALNDEMEALARRTRAELLAHLQQATDTQDE